MMSWSPPVTAFACWEKRRTSYFKSRSPSRSPRTNFIFPICEIKALEGCTYICVAFCTGAICHGGWTQVSVRFSGWINCRFRSEPLVFLSLPASPPLTSAPFLQMWQALSTQRIFSVNGTADEKDSNTCFALTYREKRWKLSHEKSSACKNILTFGSRGSC